MATVQTLLKRPTTWEDSRKSLGDMQFLKCLQEYDKD
eukprot:gene7418-biopygen5967